MQIDKFTALATSGLVVCLLGLVLLVLRMRSASYRWLGWWAAAFCLLGIGDFITSIRVGAEEHIEGRIGNTMIILGFGLIWTAMRCFEGRRPLFAVIIVPPVVWVLLGQVPGFSHSLVVRVMALSVPAAVFFALAAWETWRGDAEALPSKRITGALLAIAALVFAARVPLGPFAPYPIGGQSEHIVAVAGFNGVLIALSVATTLLLIAMSMERSENAQRALAATDPLTGLLNRRGLDLICADGKLPPGSGMILFDFDRFKQVNDTFGHAAGDLMIRAFAGICRQELRQVDHGVRLGGEEFALILARADAQLVRDTAERIRERYARLVVPIEGGALACTVSGGYCCFDDDRPVWLTAAIACVDRAMYEAKRAGRNRIFGAKAGKLLAEPGAECQPGLVGRPQSA